MDGVLCGMRAGPTYVDIDKTYGYVVWKTGASPANFAAEAIKFAADKGIAHDGQAVAAPGTVKFDDLALGYYLVKSDLGALCSLDTTMPNVIIKEKNSESTVDKQVQEDSTGDYGDHNDADIGQTVNFRTTIYVVDGEPKNYVLHDTMSAGLTFDPASVAVTIGEPDAGKGHGLYAGDERLDGWLYLRSAVQGRRAQTQRRCRGGLFCESQ